MRLQQEVHLKEGKLEQAYARLEAGEPPDQETAHQWLQMQQVRRPLLDEVINYYENIYSHTM